MTFIFLLLHIQHILLFLLKKKDVFDFNKNSAYVFQRNIKGNFLIEKHIKRYTF